MNNLYIIEIYKFKGYWVFDDPDTGLIKEALSMGTDKIIDMAVKDFKDPDNGFICMFSKNPFPDHQIKLELKTRGNDVEGNTYHCKEFGLDGWLCPALYLYFDVEPENIYLKLSEK
jgi:hypothetical protein